MACSSLNLMSSEQSPRISFSNGFADGHPHEAGIGRMNRTSVDNSPPTPASDFEFSVANYTANSTADEIFFDGKLLPLRNHSNDIFSPTFNNMKINTTLRDELLVDDYDVSEEEHHKRMRLPRAPKWKGRFSSFKIKSSLL